LLTLLFVPTHDVRDEDASLSSYVTHPNGARGLHDVLQRLGFVVERRLRPMREPLATGSLYVLLDPTVDLTAVEVHQLLQAVRAGAGLLVVPPIGSRLADSLLLRRVPEMRPSGPPDSLLAPWWADTATLRSRRLLRYVLRRPVRAADSTAALEQPAGAIVFESVDTERGRQPVIMGWPYGTGRIVAAAEPDLFANDVLRRGNAGVRVVRLFEWLVDGDPARSIVFDEYHHGFGAHADLTGVTRRALTQTGAGRALLQLALAGCILLLALAVRPIRPRARERIERRSALEHVGALSRALAAVRASGPATQLLIRGLRRRRGGWRGRGEERAYLRGLAEAKPEIRSDVEHVLTVLDGAPAARTGAGVCAAIQRIERALIS
jgi:hypothetical protein